MTRKELPAICTRPECGQEIVSETNQSSTSKLLEMKDSFDNAMQLAQLLSNIRLTSLLSLSSKAECSAVFSTVSSKHQWRPNWSIHYAWSAEEYIRCHITKSWRVTVENWLLLTLPIPWNSANAERAQAFFIWEYQAKLEKIYHCAAFSFGQKTGMRRRITRSQSASDIMGLQCWEDAKDLHDHFDPDSELRRPVWGKGSFARV